MVSWPDGRSKPERPLYVRNTQVQFVLLRPAVNTGARAFIRRRG